MRLIDADALIDELGISDEDIVFEETLEDAPTIDAVPVVRCEDCKFSELFQNDSSGVMARYCKAFTFERMVADNDFCSCGERKDDE